MTSFKTPRRTFLKQVAATGALAQTKAGQRAATETPPYPHVYRGRQLEMLAFPLGGVGAGSVSLGGRGQLRDWQIFNRADYGKAPNYAFPSIWAQAGDAKPVVRVLEARLSPPYASAGGLSPERVSGLTRLEGATFTGEF